jgi:CRP/FNR family transcriptional regulator, dissimilatory nitrate respiration regulator
MSKECIKRLEISPLFQGINHSEVGEILGYLKPRAEKYKKNDIVTFSGQSYDGIAIIARGKIAVTRDSVSGNRLILDMMESGDVFGEKIAFSYSKESPLTIIAQEDSCLFFLPLDKLVGDCNNTSIYRNILAANLLKIYSNYTTLLSKKIDYLSAKNVREKLSMYFVDIYQKTRSCSFKIPMKRHELADYLNVSRPALSKEMSLMRSEDIIDFDGSTINIKDIKSLERYT